MTPRKSTERVNVNRANAAELRQIPGIGQAYAEAIVRYRQDPGPIRDLNELDQLPLFREQSILERQHAKNALSCDLGCRLRIQWKMLGKPTCLDQVAAAVGYPTGGSPNAV